MLLKQAIFDILQISSKSCQNQRNGSKTYLAPRYLLDMKDNKIFSPSGEMFRLFYSFY